MTSFIDFRISYSEKGPNLNMESKTIAVNNHVKSLLIHKNPFQAKNTHSEPNTHAKSATNITHEKNLIYFTLCLLYMCITYTQTPSVLTHV